MQSSSFIAPYLLKLGSGCLESMGSDDGDRGQAPAAGCSLLKDREVPLLMVRQGEAGRLEN